MANAPHPRASPPLQLVLLTLLSSVACAESPGPPVVSSSIEGIADLYAERICAEATKCECVLPISESECRAALSARVRSKAPQLGELNEECLAEFVDNPGFFDDCSGIIEPPCSLFVGNLEEGQPCLGGAVLGPLGYGVAKNLGGCKEPLLCSTFTHRCEMELEPPFLPDGADCAPLSTGCAPGLRCSSAGKCSHVSQLGESCDVSMACDYPLYCHKDPLNTWLGVCMTGSEFGGACDPTQVLSCGILSQTLPEGTVKVLGAALCDEEVCADVPEPAICSRLKLDILNFPSQW